MLDELRKRAIEFCEELERTKLEFETRGRCPVTAQDIEKEWAARNIAPGWAGMARLLNEKLSFAALDARVEQEKAVAAERAKVNAEWWDLLRGAGVPVDEPLNGERSLPFALQVWRDVAAHQARVDALRQMLVDLLAGSIPSMRKYLEEHIARLEREQAKTAGAKCEECGGTGAIEDDATGALGYVVKKACPRGCPKLTPAEAKTAGAKEDGYVDPADATSVGGAASAGGLAAQSTPVTSTAGVPEASFRVMGPAFLNPDGPTAEAKGAPEQTIRESRMPDGSILEYTENMAMKASEALGILIVNANKAAAVSDDTPWADINKNELAAQVIRDAISVRADVVDRRVAEAYDKAMLKERDWLTPLLDVLGAGTREFALEAARRVVAERDAAREDWRREREAHGIAIQNANESVKRAEAAEARVRELASRLEREHAEWTRASEHVTELEKVVTCANDRHAEDQAKLRNLEAELTRKADSADFWEKRARELESCVVVLS